MKISGDIALNQFVTVATFTSFASSTIFASARIGKHLPQAPLREGYDPTIPVEAINLKHAEQYFDRRSGSIDGALKVPLMQIGKQRQAALLQNAKEENITMTATTTTKLETKTRSRDLDLGILSPDPTSTKSNLFSSTCMMGYKKDELKLANTYINDLLAKDYMDYQMILFDEKSNTVFCMQENDTDKKGEWHTFGCANMHFSGCETVKCNGKASCFGTTIDHAKTIECEGYESCRNSHLDAETIDCGGESACMGARIGSKQLVNSLDCHSGESACAYTRTYSVESVFCTGPLSCYGANLRGVTHSVSCQGVPHPTEEYSPTCGGGLHGSIIAAPGSSIDVVCNGDFSCIGNGPNSEKKPLLFPIDVGGGHLTCEGSLAGNPDGYTFVCSFIDAIQGCSSFECQAPAFASAFADIDSEQLQTCHDVLSVKEEKLCSKIDENPDIEDQDAGI
mmetsp:Transcript_23089/g.54570  ORF Transcript_23089/g.54570 Transcript_23089/m.54570 type:complete len:451 (-) Transcript_23089:98-1450(-)|eukprot:CAMPEP_0197185412 /NCGR_PEP_ID=MMETSP1423-20130617/11869_1 /TAXON_ID=476441 /ORGANISM="Pseudo-nitzschia heimii, Strain UNC1101" /LENGTH=450 /DNA_ID=CAMNT_0042636457 /DNA_START=133 /DNA_END=1485 /DNA_ORIENTATION=-